VAEFRDLPIACTLTSAELRARREELLPGLARLADRAEEIPQGRRYRFAPTSEILQAITRAIDRERQCCRFFRFHLTVEPDGGPFSLEVTGPAGTGEFLAELIDPA
jgi:hypothetical protein